MLTLLSTHPLDLLSIEFLIPASHSAVPCSSSNFRGTPGPVDCATTANQRRRLHQTSYRRRCGTFIPETALDAPVPPPTSSPALCCQPIGSPFCRRFDACLPDSAMLMRFIHAGGGARICDECHSFPAWALLVILPGNCIFSLMLSPPLDTLPVHHNPARVFREERREKSNTEQSSIQTS